MAELTADGALPGASPGSLKREIGWAHAFWVATGVPALVLFTIGAIAATVGDPSWLVWVISILFGFLQAFTYAEIAGMYPDKSGGVAVYGAMAWMPYGKVIGPISVWTNWLGWSPVLSIGTSIAAGYILSILFAADAAINAWTLTLFDLGFMEKGLSLRINAATLLGAALILVCFAIQHRGILSSARLQTIFAVCSLLPLTLIGIIPIVTGDMPLSHFAPFVPLAHDGDKIVAGHWDMAGITLFVGGLFICAWSTYGFETAVVYTREFRDPKRDTFRAIFYSGLLCLFLFTVIPLAFQGALGLDGMLDPGIYDGSGVAKAMAGMVGATGLAANVIVVMLVLTLLLAIMTAMSGSSRTLYQGSVDGFLPKFLSKVNGHGAPINAMVTDVVFNMLLLLLSDDVFLLAISNVNYLIFVFLNNNAGWIHRMDRPDWERPYRATAFMLGIAAVLGFANMFFIGMGAQSYGSGVLVAGFIATACVIPIFLFRHYLTDRGRFPELLHEEYCRAPVTCPTSPCWARRRR